MNSCPRVGGSHNGSVKAIWIIAAMLLCWLAPHESAAQSPAQAGLLDFIATHRDRHFHGVPHEVLAFYYRGTAPGTAGSLGALGWGEHDEPFDTPNDALPGARRLRLTRPGLGGPHILEAKSHGVSGFIATWWGQGFTKTAVLRSCWPARSKKISKPASIGKPARPRPRTN